jgi:hypothetical protein
MSSASQQDVGLRRRRLLARLHQRLWHATTSENARAILKDREIKPRAPGAYHNSYSRLKEAISLFDFRLDLRLIEAGPPDWTEFVNPRSNRPTLLWLELDAQRLPAVLTPDEVLDLWRKDGIGTNLIYPLEALSLGAISTSSIVGAVQLDQDSIYEFNDVADLNRLALA